MSIYRGAGGASDATDDSTVNAVAGYASAAASSASSAATSATNASNSATAAASSASSAASSASSVAANASNAANSANLASTYASAANISKDDAAASAVVASTKAGEATVSASNAATSASTATTQATSASSSASAAATSASNASSSASSAASSAASALAIYGNTAAMNNAVASAAASASSAATSASTATTQATNAAASAASAATSDSNSFANRNAAAASATAASNSASAAATSATNAATSATSAANSAASASAVVLGNEPVRPTVRPSLLLDFANTKQLDPRITFTRASTATYYDGKTTVKAEENLLTYSEQFDNSAWSKLAVAVTANSTAAPDGNTTADTITASAGSARHIEFEQLSATQAGVPHTLSVFLKQGTATFGTVCFASGGANASAWATAVVNLGTGVITQTSNGGAATSVSSSISSVGNGWYRVVLTATIPNGDGAVCIGISDSGTPTFSGYSVYNWTAAGTETMYVWGAQLEQRSSATAYTPTTTAAITNYIPALQTAASGVARFDHNPTTGESLGLLIEEQRTNLLTYSEQFDNGAWAKTLVSVSANAAIAPDGTLTADKLISDTSSGFHNIGQSLASKTASTAYTFSFYAKAGEIGYCVPNFSSGLTGAQLTCLVNLSTGAVTNISAGLTASATAVGNGWYRVSLTATGAANTNPFTSTINTCDASGNTSNTGNGYSGIYIWGAQLEAGSFATSYIPTVASQVTRSADAASMTGTNFSSWYRHDAMTVYSEYLPITASSGVPVGLDNSGTRSFIIYDSTSSLQQQYYKGTSQSSALGTATAGSNIKVAVAMDVTTAAGSMNSGTVQSVTQTMQVPNRLCIGSENTTSNVLNSTIKKVAFYPAKVTNAELQGMTTV